MSYPLRIGGVARITGLSIKAIRFYEAVGLLPPPTRSEKGYRLYGRAEIHRLQLVKQIKQWGLTLREIGGLLDPAGVGCCPTVRPGLKEFVDEKLRQIDDRIRDLQDLRGLLVDHTKRRPAAMDEDVAYCTPDRCVSGPEEPIPLLIVALGSNRFSLSGRGRGRNG